jgi:hypothetical protein
MVAYEWSREHNAFVKVCSKCKTLYIGAEDQEVAIAVFEAHFVDAGPNVKTADKFDSQCRYCRNNTWCGRLDNPNPVAMLKAQNGKCAICYDNIYLRSPTQQQSVCTDHNHKTGRTRALLCKSCNTKVGRVEMKHEEEILAYIAYWEKKHDEDN